MSEAEGSSDQALANVPQPSVRGKKSVTFDIVGNPVGPESNKFSSFVGQCVKTHISIAYESWKSVPIEWKDRLWEAITDKYEVPSRWRAKVLSRASVSWREHKSKLRDSKIYKRTRPLEEIKKDIPPNIKTEDWEKFVDQAFTSKALKKRAQAQKARANNTSLQRTGRTGVARTRHKMEQENPGKKIKRTELFPGIHTGQDGTCLNEELACTMNRIPEISESDPSSTSLDIDHVPIAKLFGKDTRGHVRGYDNAISRTIPKATRPTIDQPRAQNTSDPLGEQRIPNRAQNTSDPLGEQRIPNRAQNTSDPLGEQRIQNIVRDVFREEFARHLALHHPASVRSQMGFANAQNRSTENVIEEVDLCDLTGSIVAVGRATLHVGGGGPLMCDVVLDIVLEPTTPIALDPAKRILSQVGIGDIITWPAVLVTKHRV